MDRLSLRARLVAAFTGVVAVGTLLAAVLTMLVVHRTFDDYLDRRAREATVGAVRSAEEIVARDAGRWTETGLDQLAHELVLTGYDFRLVDGERVLMDTTKTTSGGRPLVAVAESAVRGPAGEQAGTLQVYALRGGGSTPADAAFRAQLDRIHLVAAVIASALAIVLGLLLARRLTGPLRALAAAARSLPGPVPIAPIHVEGAPEVQDLARALSNLSEDLDRQHRARRHLAQDLAHELRTPLTLVLSRIEGMLDGVIPFDGEGLESLRREVLRLTRLIGDIEQLAEFEARPRHLHVVAVDLEALAVEAGEAHRDLFAHAAITFLVDARPVVAWGDRDAARQVITNLLSNALKYTPEGGRVSLQTLRIGVEAHVVVADTGPGIGADELAKVFDRTYRGRTTRSSAAGTGLGLAIAHELAGAQGGTLTLSPSFQGATFTLALPAVEATAVEVMGSPRASEPRVDSGV